MVPRSFTVRSKNNQRDIDLTMRWAINALVGGAVLLVFAIWSEPTLAALHWRHASAHPAVGGPAVTVHAKKEHEPSSDTKPQPVTRHTTTHDYTIPPITDGAVPVISRIPTKQPVVFLTIDDGIVAEPDDAQLMQAAHVKATFFLVYRFIKDDPSFFANLSAQTGSDIQNHSYDHYVMTNLTYEQQKIDICKNADIFAEWYGKRPVLFRPSGGAYNDNTLRAAAACGMKALVLWDATVNNGEIAYQGDGMHAGDIVLMHFRSAFAEDLQAFVAAAHAAGLQPDLLINWQD